jgi:hypothetical protein
VPSAGVARWGLFAYFALLPLAAAGAAIARRRGIPIYQLLVFPVVVVPSVLLAIAHPKPAKAVAPESPTAAVGL